MVGHLAKLDRAQKHLDDLYVHVDRWLKEKRYTVREEPEPNRPKRFIVFASAEPIPADPFALLTGDIIQNARNCLDHLAYGLAAAHTKPLPESIAKNSQFLIFGDERDGKRGTGAADFSAATKKRLVGIHPKAHAVIQSLQPYHRRDDFRAHPLWRLHDLSNIDKHRLLLSTSFLSMGAVIRAAERNRLAIPRQIRSANGGFMEQETEIVRYTLRGVIDPQRKMQVDFRPGINIAFRCGSVADGKGVLDVLAEICHFIRQDVIPPLTPYL